MLGGFCISQSVLGNLNPQGSTTEDAAACLFPRIQLRPARPDIRFSSEDLGLELLVRLPVVIFESLGELLDEELALFAA